MYSLPSCKVQRGTEGTEQRGTEGKDGYRGVQRGTEGYIGVQRDTGVRVQRVQTITFCFSFQARFFISSLFLSFFVSCTDVFCFVISPVEYCNTSLDNSAAYCNFYTVNC